MREIHTVVKIFVSLEVIATTLMIIASKCLQTMLMWRYIVAGIAFSHSGKLGIQLIPFKNPENSSPSGSC